MYCFGGNYFFIRASECDLYNLSIYGNMFVCYLLFFQRAQTLLLQEGSDVFMYLNYDFARLIQQKLR